MENWFLVHPEPVRGRQSLTLLKNAKNQINGAFLAADSGSGSGENAKFYWMKKNCIELISISYLMTRWVLVHPEPARGLQKATAPKNAQNGAFAGCWREGERLQGSPPAAARGLVERFDIEPFSDFSAKWANFTGLVLFCIDAKFCK